MSAFLSSSHLLLFDHALTDHLIGRRLDKASGNLFSFTIAISLIGYELTIVRIVGFCLRIEAEKLILTDKLIISDLISEF